MELGNKSIVSNMYDIILICLPIWIPILLFILFKSYTTRVASIFLLALFFLGETHFGATWLFFFDSNNRIWMKESLYKSFIFPLLIIIFFVLVFFKISPSAAIVLASIASAWHVTRQSIGINKLYGTRDHKGVKLSNLAIYGMSGFFLFVGFIRFFTKYNITIEQLKIIQITGVVLTFLIFTFLLFKKNNRELSIKFHLTTLTGILIYAPYTFVPRPEYAVAMGVGMHWLQYLALTAPIYLRKSKENIIIGNKNLISKIAKNKLTLFFYLIIYAGLMVILRQWNKGFNTFDYSLLIIIPLSLQVLHFYYDGLIWRFSDPHIRKEIGTYVFKKTEQKPEPTKIVTT